MRVLKAVVASCAGLLLTVGCGGGGGGSRYHVSYTYGGEQVVLTVGLDEAGGVPHGEVLADELDLIACGGQCSQDTEPLHWVQLYLDSTVVGETTGGLSSSDFEGQEEITAEVTRVDADGGVIEGMFSGTTVTNGSFRVHRDDAVGWFSGPM